MVEDDSFAIHIVITIGEQRGALYVGMLDAVLCFPTNKKESRCYSIEYSQQVVIQ